MASINIHDVGTIEARESNGVTWLYVKGRDDTVCLHLDFALARKLEAAFADYQREKESA